MRCVHEESTGNATARRNAILARVMQSLRTRCSARTLDASASAAGEHQEARTLVTRMQVFSPAAVLVIKVATLGGVAAIAGGLGPGGRRATTRRSPRRSSSRSRSAIAIASATTASTAAIAMRRLKRRRPPASRRSTRA